MPREDVFSQVTIIGLSFALMLPSGGVGWLIGANMAGGTATAILMAAAVALGVGLFVVGVTRQGAALVMPLAVLLPATLYVLTHIDAPVLWSLPGGAVRTASMVGSYLVALGVAAVVGSILGMVTGLAARSTM